jgi:Predicted membrane protein
MYDLAISFVFYSIVGYVYETILCSIAQRRFVKRGFLLGPYCPIYGFGALIDILALGWVKNPLLLFFLGGTLACILEYFTSWLLEILFHAKWWDYSRYKFNIRGRICLLGFLVFGLFAVVLNVYIHPFVTAKLALIPLAAHTYLAVFLLVVMLSDTVLTTKRIGDFNEKLKKLQSYIMETLEDSQTPWEHAKESAAYAKLNGAFKEKIEKLTRFERHVFYDFPHFNSTRYDTAVGKLRIYLKNSKKHDD